LVLSSAEVRVFSEPVLVTRPALNSTASMLKEQQRQKQSSNAQVLKSRSFRNRALDVDCVFVLAIEKAWEQIVAKGIAKARFF
jgi:hypothetical protein